MERKYRHSFDFRGIRQPSKIICVGRNYRAHCTELSNPIPSTPILFLKPSSSISALVPSGFTPIPTWTPYVPSALAAKPPSDSTLLSVGLASEQSSIPDAPTALPPSTCLHAPCLSGSTNTPTNTPTTKDQKSRDPNSMSIHHEIELAVVVGEELCRATPQKALAAVSGYRIALDLTDRSAQTEEKRCGWPWTLSKCRDGFLPLTHRLFSVKEVNLSDTELSLRVNGEERQKGNTNDMIFRIPELLAYISSAMTISSGDIVLTGTPSGVGELEIGDRLDLRLLSRAADGSLLTDFNLTSQVSDIDDRYVDT